MKELRSYQSIGAITGADILIKHRLLYIAWGVRTGKTATSMEVARLFGAKNVLFSTKKKAITSINNDYIDFGFDKYFNITIINTESLHKVDGDFDLVISDEHHKYSSFPKPSTGAKYFRERFNSKPIIMVSGTPSPESFTQMFHQLWVSAFSPWKKYLTFYRWAQDYVDIRKKKIGQFAHNDYSRGFEDKIMKSVDHIMITFTQEQAGFESSIEEEVLHVDMTPSTYKMIDKLCSDLIIEGKQEVIMADTAVKLMQKMMQLYSGTIKFESGNSMTLDTTKAEYVRDKFKGMKIGIFYIFKEELNLLKQVFGDDLCVDVEEFNSTDKNIALQVISGREGINLSKAEYLVFINIHHSATSYWQARDRMTTMDRRFNKVYWVFSKGGIEDKIYKTVKLKRKYTTNIFNKDYARV
jgi:hypothetical protein